MRRKARRGVLYDDSPAVVTQITNGRRGRRERDAQRIGLDRRDGELVRVAAYIALRLGELPALRGRKS